MSAATAVASAPGKLILLGEYAVLEGATALVAAVDRRAGAATRATSNAEIRVTAPDLGIETRGRLAADGTVRWDADAATADRLRLVATVVQAVATSTAALRDRRENHVISELVARGARPEDRAAGFAATLSTTAFFDTPGVKLGLGSSAALTVALAGALHALAGLDAPELADLVRIHRSAQGGRGSGADIAAALSGGVIEYSGGDADRPVAEPVRLPTGLHWCCAFTGRSTSTAGFLRALGAWRLRDPAAYRARMGDLTATAAAGATAARHNDLDALLEAIDAYRAQLDGLGGASGIDIVGAEHRAIGNAAAGCGVIYKPSGAGGGDIGVGFARDADHIGAFRRAVMRLGYVTVDAAVDPQGLTISSE